MHPDQVGVVKEYGDDGERAQAVEARPVRQPHLMCARRCKSTSVRSLAADLSVGCLRLSQRVFRRFPPSESRKVILAQSKWGMQDHASGKVLHMVLIARLFPLVSDHVLTDSRNQRV